MQAARTQTSSFSHLVLRRSPGSDPGLLPLYKGLEMNHHQPQPLWWQLSLRGLNIFCVVMHYGLHFTIRYTHLSPSATQSESFRHVLKVKKSITYKPALTVLLFFLPNTNSVGSSCLTIGSWMTPELRDIFTSHTATQLLLFKQESQMNAAARALATRLTLSCRSRKFAI